MQYSVVPRPDSLCWPRNASQTPATYDKTDITLYKNSLGDEIAHLLKHDLFIPHRHLLLHLKLINVLLISSLMLMKFFMSFTFLCHTLVSEDECSQPIAFATAVPGTRVTSDGEIPSFPDGNSSPAIN